MLRDRYSFPYMKNKIHNAVDQFCYCQVATKETHSLRTHQDLKHTRHLMGHSIGKLWWFLPRRALQLSYYR